MTTHLSDDLPRLLTGDATRDEVMAAATHLRTCIDCQQELVSAVVAHASLTSAHRFAAEVIAARDEEPVSPDVSSVELPDLSAIFAQAREEAAGQTGAKRTRQPRGRARFAVAAAAAGVLIGGGGYALVSHAGGSSSPTGSQVALAAFGEGTHPAQARLGSGKLTVDATSLPSPGSQHRYEVWLTNSARTQMQPVGWVGANGKATLSVPQDLVTHFSAIEVSVQDVDAPSYDFSGTSVLRGSYTD